MKKPAKKRAKRIKKPKHKGEVRAFKFALRLGQDVSKLHAALDIACELRNSIAADRLSNSWAIRDAKRADETPPAWLTKRDQEMLLAALRKSDPAGAGSLHSLVVKNIADRIDEGWKRFWDALKEGRGGVKPPHEIKRKRYRSITYPQYGNGVRIRNGRVELSKIGSFRLHDHRKICGTIQTVTMKWANGRWWCIVTARMAAKSAYRPAAEHARDIGADPGLAAVLTLSDGRSYDPPRAFDMKLQELKKEQRILSRKFEKLRQRQKAEDKAAKIEGRDAVKLPLPNRLKRQIAQVGKVHTKIANIRDHWHKLNARRIADRYNRVGLEDHGVMFMIRNRKLAKSASDRALSKQKHALKSALGDRLVLVPNQRLGIGGNSQTCLCGASVPKTLKDRWHECSECGLSAPRDVVSANIVETIAFGTASIARSPGRGSIDAQEANVSPREDAAAPGDEPVRASAKGDDSSMASTSCDLSKFSRNPLLLRGGQGVFLNPHHFLSSLFLSALDRACANAIRICLGLDIGFDNVERRAATRDNAITRGPEVISPQARSHFRPLHLTKLARADTFDRPNQAGKSNMRRVLDQKMDVISIRFISHELRAEISAYRCHGLVEKHLHPIRCDCTASVLGR